MVGNPEHTYVERMRRKRATIAMLLAADAFMLFVATIVAQYTRFKVLSSPADFTTLDTVISYTQVGLGLVVICLFFLAVNGLYEIERLFWGSGEFRRLVESTGVGVAAFVLITYAFHMTGLSRGWVLLTFLYAAILLSVGRVGARHMMRRMMRTGKLMRRTLIVGCNAEALDVVTLLRRTKASGLDPVGYVSASNGEKLPFDELDGVLPNLGSSCQVREIVDREEVDTVVIVASSISQAGMSKTIAALRGMELTIHLSTGLSDVLTSRMLVRELAGVPLITVRSVTFSKWQRIAKRAFDIAVASAIIVVGMPVWLLLAAIVKLDTPGPVFYRQERVGKDGVRFGMFKFRSMDADAERRLEALRKHNEASGPLFKMKEDPRITRSGKWMRRYSLDEFPQLINVIRGEMSLVGPRPPLPEETRVYMRYHWRRMEVLPGMTGLWQVSGRSSLSFDEMIRLDLFYIENWTVTFDLALMLRTVPAMIAGEGAY